MINDIMEGMIRYLINNDNVIMYENYRTYTNERDATGVYTPMINNMSKAGVETPMIHNTFPLPLGMIYI